MLTEVCAEIRNYFLTHRENDIHSGTFTISGGSLELDYLLDGQYFRIVGSVLNDGVHQYPATDLRDETFEGSVWAMSVPRSVVELAEEIEGWIASNNKALSSPYTSESFAGYSYSKASGRNGSAGYSWQDQFATRLNAYRRLSVL